VVPRCSWYTAPTDILCGKNDCFLLAQAETRIGKSLWALRDHDAMMSPLRGREREKGMGVGQKGWRGGGEKKEAEPIELLKTVFILDLK
jgi:hypothetical protein